ncbi:MAG: Uma2 family endonuclease [Leptospiraceae bacterium]|nr:Uma2 family endonuclease [Leptospiraceae bacterium]MCP5494188.1 Uma2 family endonuclease [Leptospiraceae bacterium]
MNSILNEATLKRIFLYDIATYHKLGETGVLPRNTELIRGVLVSKMTISPIHSKIVTKLGYVLSRYFANNYVVRQEKPITIKNSEPEPDISVVQGNYDDFGEEHPKTAAFVIEVSYSSLDEDIDKASIYASANISYYWIVDIQNKQIHIYENPIGQEYQTKKTCGLNEQLPIPLTNHNISLAEIL